MTFVSYAQNFEDIILNRALKGVEKGFYIDVGANDPVADSVTKAFYDAGWRGINIEPVSEWFEKLEQDRPDDKNLQLAAGEKKGKVSFYEVLGTGLSTMDKSIADGHAKEHGFEVKEYKVPVVSLSSICKQYVNSDIHFLKIDVEGSETKVLKGLNLKEFRPWIILVESTLPLSQVENYEEWEELLLNAHYEYCYFDGLNRFYIADEHHEIKTELNAPPNVFDDFIFSGKGSSGLHLTIGHLQKTLEESDEQRQSLASSLQQAEQQHQDLTSQLQSLQTEAAQREQVLQHKETREKELLLSLLEKETKQQESNALIADYKQQMEQLHRSLSDSDEQRQSLASSLQQAEQQHQDLTSQLQSLQTEAAQREQVLQHKETREKELKESNHHWRLESERLSKELVESSEQIEGLNQSSHHWWLESERLSKELNTIYHSKSWVITWPLRKLSQFVQWFFFLPIRFTLWIIRLPKRIARWVLVKAMVRSLKYPKLKNRMRMWLKKYPRLYSKLCQLAVARKIIPAPLKTSDSLVSPLLSRSVDVVYSQGTENLYVEPLPLGKRNVFIYVDHTVSCPTNTGVQRVTRGVASSLRSLGEKVYFVKWDPVAEQCVFINMQEREHFAKWNGPDISSDDRKIYTNEKSIPVALQPKGENHWMIVPEVTHITNHPNPVTLELLHWGHCSGLKMAFVFYDAIPLRREDLQDMRPKHEEYMQHLLLADVIWPISFHSGNDLISFFAASERASNKTMPEITPVPLSGESYHCARVLESDDGDALILSVGSIDQRKNQVALIKAFEAYRKRNPDSKWRLTLVGNLHPLVAEEVNRAQSADKNILHLGHISDEELDMLYRSSSFTVFPSVEEGFGLPILESLWYGKPCVCANFGSMGEVAEGGGCFTIDTRNQSKLDDAIAMLIDDNELRESLAKQAVLRPIISWTDYGAVLQDRFDNEVCSNTKLEYVYYWMDATLDFSGNTGIQRVARQLARGIISEGMALIPVKWNESGSRFCPVSQEELFHFGKWNGPSVDSWHTWREPKASRNRDWFFMPDLPLNRSTDERRHLLEYVRNNGLRCAAIFYDAIPWKMRDIYPEHFANALREYMLELGEYDLVLPISNYCREDLLNFLGNTLPRTVGVDERIKAAVLPGEFPESSRVTKVFPSEVNDSITILSVGTVEPRKNHEILLRAFDSFAKKTGKSIHLIIAGGGHSIEPDLATRVRYFVENHPNVTWEESPDDKRIQELYQMCDFTVYPSMEEGFGLPILESLWYAKPCICADFGSMREVAEDGGCLMVDVRNVDTLEGAIQRLTEDIPFRDSLANEAINRSFKSWHGYASEVLYRMDEVMPNQVSTVTITKDEIESRVKAMHLLIRPKLSICISTYNRADWLAVSLKNWAGLYPKALQDVELLVCDNASTDHTLDVVKPYMSRSDFSYHCNEHNVGMLGNLRKTANHCRGEYVWILGDDDLLMPGSIERVMGTLQSHQDISLVYLNYSFTRIEDARTVSDFDDFFNGATPIVPAELDLEGQIKDICARNENFFTAIYTLVFRRDHAIRAYSQDTSGRPFSTMLTCIPTTYYVLNNMMDEFGVWIGEPQLVVNMNVSWMKYAPLWILERIPEVYDLAEDRGVSADQMDCWRLHTLPGVVHYFKEIFEKDPLNNADYFKADRVLRRFKHLPGFSKIEPELRDVYETAYSKGHTAALKPVSVVFPQN